MKKILIPVFILLAGMLRLSALEVYTDNQWHVNKLGFSSNNNEIIPEPTAFRVRFSGTALEVEFKLEGFHWKEFQKHPFKLTPGVWPRCESVEVFLDPGRTCSRYVQLAVGFNGEMYDNRYTEKTGKKWAGKWSVKRKDFKGGSYITFIIPYDSDIKKPQPGELWGFNVCRNVMHTTSYYSTFAKVGHIFNTPSKFAELRFGTKEEFRRLNQRKNLKKLAELEKEVKSLGLLPSFAEKIRVLKQDCNDTDLQDFIDELKITKCLKEAK